MDPCKIASGLFERAENAYKSFHLKSFNVFNETDDFVRYEGIVFASMKKEIRNVMVRIKLDKLISWACDCPIGKAKCHHMGVVLYHIVSTESCTDEACKWIRKNGVDCPTQTVNEMIGQTKMVHSSQEELEDIRRFLRTALSDVTAPIPAKWILNDEVNYDDDDDNELNRMDMENIILSEDFLKCPCEERLKFLEWSCYVTDEEITNIAEKTTGQMKNILYCIIKKYRITASNFGVVLSAVRRKTYAPSLFGRLLNAYNLNKVKAICWGLDHEETAFKKFQTEYSQLGLFKQIGVFLHPSGLIGASPDAVSCDATLEIKCPYKHRLVNDLTTTLTRKENYIIWYNTLLKAYIVNTKHHYYDQIQGQMYFAGKKISFLFIWTVNSHALVRIDKNPFWEENVPKIIRFFVDTFIPHVLENKDLDDFLNDNLETFSSEEE